MTQWDKQRGPVFQRARRGEGGDLLDQIRKLIRLDEAAFRHLRHFRQHLGARRPAGFFDLRALGEDDGFQRLVAGDPDFDSADFGLMGDTLSVILESDGIHRAEAEGMAMRTHRNGWSRSRCSREPGGLSRSAVIGTGITSGNGIRTSGHGRRSSSSAFIP